MENERDFKAYGYSGLTLLDFPGRMAAEIFCGGCNMSCPFCHNAGLAKNPAGTASAISKDELLANIKRRSGVLDGIVVTGGEPTLTAGLTGFLEEVRELNLLIKLDTNGLKPDVVAELIEKKLVDYIAMDIKAPKEKYAIVSGVPGIDTGILSETMSIICSSGLEHEFRTTAVGGLHDPGDINSICGWIRETAGPVGFNGLYAIQAYRDSGAVMSPDGLRSPTADELLSMAQEAHQLIGNVTVRGCDDPRLEEACRNRRGDGIEI